MLSIPQHSLLSLSLSLPARVQSASCVMSFASSGNHVALPSTPYTRSFISPASRTRTTHPCITPPKGLAVPTPSIISSTVLTPSPHQVCSLLTLPPNHASHDFHTHIIVVTSFFRPRIWSHEVFIRSSFSQALTCLDFVVADALLAVCLCWFCRRLLSFVGTLQNAGCPLVGFAIGLLPCCLFCIQ
ncbi:hypothetical protein C8Q74DRAFT_1056405 [Fomes fomentarius]|nr:hypothetical protein C8Q74DRAFT_1056405 [Fomes fomentarius]